MRLAKEENLPFGQYKAWRNNAVEIKEMLRAGDIERDINIYLVTDDDDIVYVTTGDFIPMSGNVIVDYLRLDVVGVRGSCVMRDERRGASYGIWVGRKEVKKYLKKGYVIVERIPWR